MSFLVNYKDGEFSLASSISPSCWCEMQESDKLSSEIYYCRFLRFDCDPKFHFESSIYLRQCKTSGGSNYTNVHVGIKDKDSDKTYYVHFESFLPFCKSSMNNVEQAFICFLNTIYLFDSAEEASLVISTKEVFDYQDPQILADRIESLAKIVAKYGHSKKFFLKERIVEWLRQAMLKYGYSFVKLNEVNEKFPETFSLLNSLGFSASKF